MIDCNGSNLPMESNVRLEKNNSTDDTEYMKNKPFMEVLGKLNYLALCTRPDLSVVLTKLSKYSQNPSRIHWKQLKETLRYLKSTMESKVNSSAAELKF